MSVALAVLTAFAALASDVRYVDASVEVEGELLDARFVRLGAKRELALCLAVRTPRGTRELRVHAVGRETVAATPHHVVAVLEDVIAYGFAEVRSEPGPELVFLTKSGAHSYSLERDGYRDNVRRLVDADLIYDVPDPRRLPYWRYATEGLARDVLLLPGPGGLGVFAADASEAADAQSGELTRAATIELPVVETPAFQGALESGEVVVEGASATIRFVSRDDEPPFDGGAGDAGELLSHGRAVRAPAWADFDGDGRRDLVVATRTTLFVHHARADGVPRAEPVLVQLPAYLVVDEDELALTLVDVDGDGDADLLAERTEEADGLENARITLFVLVNRDGDLVREEPDQVFRFEAAAVRFEVGDVDGDGRPDLVTRKFELPSFVGTVTGLEFTLSYAFYPGTGGARPFEARPTMRHDETFDETTVQEVIANRHMTVDCDGDGLADLVEVDIEGRIVIRRLVRESSFFGGTSWSLEREPWKRFETRGSIGALTVRDLNGDGLGDIVSRGYDRCIVLLSAGGRR